MEPKEDCKAMTVTGDDLAYSGRKKQGFFGNLVDKVRLASKAAPDKSAIEKGIITLDDRLTWQGKELFFDYMYRTNKANFFADPGVAALLAEKEEEKV